MKSKLSRECNVWLCRETPARKGSGDAAGTHCIWMCERIGGPLLPALSQTCITALCEKDEFLMKQFEIGLF
jgi:hypothetical protein